MAKPKRSLKSEENMPLRPKYEGRNDNGAFQIWQVPNKLRGKPSGINQKPNVPNVGGSRAQRPAQQPQLDPENLRELVKQKRKVSEARSTPTTSTSTTTATSSTTSTVPTTSTIQTETSSMSTSNKARKRTKGWDKSDTPKLQDKNFNQAMSTPVHTEFNVPDTNSNPGYYPDAIAGPIEFRISLPDTTLINPSDLAVLPAKDATKGETLHKLCLNASSLSAVWTDSALSPKNEDFNTALKIIYNRISIDIIKSSRANLYNDWSFENFKLAMSHVARGLENLYALDSILAYLPSQSDPANVNKTLMDYANRFNTSAILAARDKLRNGLKATWFPSNYSALFRWFYQTYRTNNLSTAAYYKFVPSQDFIVSANVLQGDLANTMNTVRGNLFDLIPSKIYAMLANIYPVGMIKTLPLCTSDAYFDNYHYEIFVNDPIVYSDRGNTGKTSVYPNTDIPTTGPGKDIPYYQNTNPHSGNNDGLPFALQCIFKCATGNELPDEWIGLRKNLALDTPSAWTTEGGSKCSKFSYVPEKGGGTASCVPRANQVLWALGSNDAHKVLSVGTATTWTSSTTNTSFQRVYFNNSNAPLINNNRLLDALFSITPNT